MYQSSEKPSWRRRITGPRSFPAACMVMPLTAKVLCWIPSVSDGWVNLCVWRGWSIGLVFLMVLCTQTTRKSFGFLILFGQNQPTHQVKYRSLWLFLASFIVRAKWFITRSSSFVNVGLQFDSLLCSTRTYMIGIYVGEDYVIHFTRTESKRSILPSLSRTNHKQEISSPCPKCKYQKSINCGVVKTCLDCFRQDGKKLQSLHCYEYGWSLLEFELARRGTCTTLPGTKLPHQVVDKASKLHTSNAFGNYNLINNNCEHFATFCRTDIRKSEQTAFVSNCERKFKGAKEWTMRLLQRNRI